MKREIKLRIILDSDIDEFGMGLDLKGFNEKTPVQNSLLISSLLQIASRQELEKFPLDVEE